MGKRMAGIVFLILLFAVPLVFFSTGGYEPLKRAATARTEPLKKTEAVFKGRFPASDYLRNMQVSLKYIGGNKQQNGVFISENALMLDVPQPNQTTVNKNINAMVKFVEDYNRRSYVMLIPTACAVQQTPYAAPLYDQRQLMDDVYRRVSGYLTAVDVYPILRNHQNEYIYYRTDNTITGMGGYYIYSTAAKKMGHSKPRGINEFDVEHLDYNYYGDLYALSPYREIPPDRVSSYIFSRYRRSYSVTHYENNGASRRYYTLYPKFKAELGTTKDILLGGMSPMVDISITNSQFSEQLLIFGDRSVQSYLPFLMIHYGRVTFVDTSKISTELLREVDISEYNQVLFAYSVDTFIGSEQFASLGKLTPPAIDEIIENPVCVKMI